MVNERVVRILLECILVLGIFGPIIGGHSQSRDFLDTPHKKYLRSPKCVFSKKTLLATIGL